MKLFELRDALVNMLEEATERVESRNLWSGEPSDVEQDKVFRVVINGATPFERQRDPVLWRAAGLIDYRTTINVLDEAATATAAYGELDTFVSALRSWVSEWSVEVTQAEVQPVGEDLVTTIRFRVMTMEDA